MNIEAKLKRIITFKKMNHDIVKSYCVYSMVPDSTRSTGFRKELLEEVHNPIKPDTVLKGIKLEASDDFSWVMPNDIYLDIDHKFKVYMNDFILSPMKYDYNHVTNILTINQKLTACTETDKFSVEYFRDVITRTYILEDDIKIVVTPVMRNESHHGNHNVIM